MTKKSTTQKKVGALGNSEMVYIKEHAMSMPVQQIAMNLNRQQAPIIKYMKKHNLGGASFTEDEKVTMAIKRDLYREPWWENVTTQCDSKEEKELFVALWVQVMTQLQNEVTSTEKLQVKDMVFMEIFANRVMSERANQVRQIDEFKSEVAELQRDQDRSEEDNQKILYLNERISYLKNSLGAYSKEFMTLSNSKEALLKTLKSTREQRKKNIEDSTTNFGGYIKMLTDEKARRTEGFEVESLKVAKDKALQQLSKPFKYQDGEWDRPILNCESVMGDEDDEEEETGKDDVHG